MEGESTYHIYNERLRLATLSKEDFYRVGLFSAIFALWFLLFHLMGNTTDLKNYSRSAILWLTQRWSMDSSFGNGDFSHGWLIPVVSISIVYMKRREFLAAPKEVSKLGLFVLISALLLHWLGAKAQHPRLSIMAIILTFWGIPFYFWGWHVAKLLIFPCAYLIFCIPMSFLDAMTFPLRMFAAGCSSTLLNGLGLENDQVGTGIHLVSGYKLDVAGPCSGLRSLLALTALTAVYAFLTQKNFFKKWLLFLSAIPLAIIGNVCRIATIGLVQESFGADMTTGIYHDYSGYIVFAVAIGLMVAVGSALNVDYKTRFQKWKKMLSSPTS